jgi:hypothetical protein
MVNNENNSIKVNTVEQGVDDSIGNMNNVDIIQEIDKPININQVDITPTDTTNTGEH